MKKTLAILLAAVMLCGLFVGCGKSGPKSPLDEYAHLKGVYVRYAPSSESNLTIDFELDGEEVRPVVAYDGFSYLTEINDGATIAKLGDDGYLIRATSNWMEYIEITIDPKGTEAEVEWGGIDFTCYRAEE